MENENVLIESKTAREETLIHISEERVSEVFTKVKGLILLPNNTHVTTEMVANYYEVGIEAINSLIKDHRDEVNIDGLKVLEGEQLKSFKDICQIQSRAKSLTIIPRKAILRIGMLLRDSEIAKRIRTYLLNVEENTKPQDKLIALSQDSNDVLKLLQDEIKDLKHSNGIIISENEEFKTIAYNLINKVDELLNQPLFKLYVNFSSSYEKLIIEFTEIMNSKGYGSNYGKNYSLFNKEFGNWVSVDFGNKKLNKKEYWLSFYGLEIIQHFIYGIKQGTIIKNKEHNWVDLNGVYCNKVEWRKILKEFNNKCAYCGNEEMLMAEHIIPQSKSSSTNKIHNIIPSCPICNEKKGDTPMNLWLNMKKEEGLSEESIEKIRDHWSKFVI